MEASEIQRAQTIAADAQQKLEEAANNVRVITAALRAGQETVANAALRAQTAQLQLAAHDQLLFTARQKVDAISAHMVGLQAEVGINADTKMSVDLPALLNRLKEPLRPDDQPKPIPQIGGTGDHELNSHSANEHNSWSTFNKPNEMAQKRSVTELTNGDLSDLLQWVHQARNQEVEKSIGSGYEENSDGNQKYTNDFIKNINMDLEKKSVDSGSTSFATRSNAEIINDSLKAVGETRARRDTKYG